MLTAGARDRDDCATVLQAFADLLASLSRESTAPGSSDLAISWAAAEIVLRNNNSRNAFTWISWASPQDPLPDDSELIGPIQRFTWAMHDSATPPSWAHGTRGRNAWFWNDIVQQVKRLHFIYRTKLAALFESCEQALADANLLVASLLMRSILENVATTYATWLLLKSKLEGIDVGALTETELVDDELKRKLGGRFRATRFNWEALAANDAAAWITKPELGRKDHKDPSLFPQIMDDIDAVAESPRYSAFRHAYAWMCEYVHPNVGSHLIFLKSAQRLRGRLVASYRTTATREEVILFLEPFAAALCTCAEIVVTALPEYLSLVRPLEDWCDAQIGSLVTAQ